MALTQEELTQLLGLSFEDTYKLLRALQRDPDRNINQKELEKIRFGIKLEFDVNACFTGHITDKFKGGIVIVGTRAFKTRDYFSEMEERESLAKYLLLKTTQEKDLLQSR